MEINNTTATQFHNGMLDIVLGTEMCKKRSEHAGSNKLIVAVLVFSHEDLLGNPCWKRLPAWPSTPGPISMCRPVFGNAGCVTLSTIVRNGRTDCENSSGSFPAASRQSQRQARAVGREHLFFEICWRDVL
jgi:hypothetical protein